MDGNTTTLTGKLATYKRIILCADGTWLSSDMGGMSLPSNVAKISRAIANNGPDAEGNLVKQVVSYYAGLGSGDLPFQKAIYGGLGWGLDSDVCQIYDFISNNYEPGDELFFFGFSRGAFTVRSVASIVCDVGILSAENMPYFPELWKEYRKNTSGEPFRQTAWYKENKDRLDLTDVKIKVVGVWDTVGALGIPEWPLVDWAKMAGFPINKEYAFHNTKVSEHIDYAFQALAIDERRLTFPPTLWHMADNGPAKEMQQCWFPGVHGNVGGQAEMRPDYKAFEGIGHVTFAWMVDNLSGMLTFENAMIERLIKEHRDSLKANNIPNGWGCWPFVDNFFGLQGAFFRLLGKKDRTPGDYPEDPDGTRGFTNETFHPITRMRKRRLARYNPQALKGFTPRQRKGVGGWEWAKDGLRTVPEYVMLPEKRMSVAYQTDDGVQYTVKESLSRLLCPTDILSELDHDNGI